MRAQHFAQRRMQQMRAGMVAHGRVADFGVDHGIDFVADLRSAAAERLVRATPCTGWVHPLTSATTVL